MRQKLALAVAGLAAAAAFGPVQQASACIALNTPIGSPCLTPCSVIGTAYRAIGSTNECPL